MALKELFTRPQIIPYEAYTDWPPPPQGFYNSSLIKPPRHYAEAIDDFTHFFYDPGEDALMAYAWLSIIGWPGWAVNWFKWRAGDGVFIGRGQASFWSMSYCSGVGVGSGSKFYGFWVESSTIQEINPANLTCTGGWNIDPTAWTDPPQSYRFGQVIVNREDNLVAGVNNTELEVWDISNPVQPVRRGGLRLPAPLGALAYENRENCWIITRGGQIAKANYALLPPRWEMLSTVQNPVSDAIAYFCTFDTGRQRLAVLRVRPDAADGACQSQLEFYRPLYAAALLTEPVPVGSLQAGAGAVDFVAHLWGAAGEGLCPYNVDAALGGTPAGLLKTPQAATALNGAVSFRYQPPLAGASEVLGLSIDLEA